MDQLRCSGVETCPCCSLVSCCSGLLLRGGGTSDIFVAISVQATTGPAQTQAYPISQSRRLLPGRQLSLRCIPSRPHYRLRWHLLSINTRNATCFLEHLAGFF